jgi:hypothetical protein
MLKLKDVPIIPFFGWFADIPLVLVLSEMQEDIVRGDPRLLQLMYKMGSQWLNAVAHMPDTISTTPIEFHPKAFMSFAPGYVYHHLPTKGSYISQMPSVEAFYKKFFEIESVPHPDEYHPEFDPRTQNMLHLVLIYDFMAWTAVALRTMLPIEFNAEQLERARTTLSIEINVLAAETDTNVCTDFSYMLAAVVMNIQPAPHSISRNYEGTYIPAVQRRKFPLVNEDTQDHVHKALSKAHRVFMAESPCEDTYEDVDGPQKRKRMSTPVKSILKKNKPVDTQTPSSVNYASEYFQSPHRENNSDSGSTHTSVSFNPTSPYDSDTERFKCPDDPDIGTQLSSAFDDVNQPSAASSSATSVAPVNPNDNEPTPLDAASSHCGSSTSYNTFHALPSVSINVLKRQPVKIMDSGASMSGTGDISVLKNVRDFEGMTVLPAFGEPIKATQGGTMGALDLPTLFIKEMKDQTIVSVSQLMAQGHIAVFTAKDFRVYKTKSAIAALSTLAQTGNEIARGTVQDGLYVIDSM